MELQNYQCIIGISETSIGIINKRLVYVIKVTVLEHENLQSFPLIPIPTRQGNRFIAPIPLHEIIPTNLEKSFYLYMHFETLKSCKNIDDLRICKRTQSTYLIRETHSCETTIMKHQNTRISDKTCQFSVFRILELIFIPLKDPHQYILIPEAHSELNVLCKTNAQTLKLNFTSLLFSNEDCII